MRGMAVPVFGLSSLDGSCSSLVWSVYNYKDHSELAYYIRVQGNHENSEHERDSQQH